MNRKQKIIVSVVAILIVTLALVGITYAYFLTAIQGNTNTKSIEVSTANLVVDYGEDTNVIQTKTGLTPGNVAVTKTFSATNHGSDEAGYVTILRDVTYKNTRDNSSINGFERQQDLTYTLTCKQFNESNVETGTCDGVTDYIFPQSIDVSIMVSNKVPVGYTHKYTLTINYLEAGVDQSHDMAKSFSAKVDIEDVKRLNNPYDTGVSPENNKSLAYNIIQNATINKNGTSLVSSPMTRPGNSLLQQYIKSEPTVFDLTSSITTTTANNYVKYSDNYTIDPLTGLFTLIKPKVAKYIDIYNSLSGKYFVGSSFSIFAGRTSSNAEAVNSTNTSTIFKVNTATSSSASYALVTKNTRTLEKVLSISNDDYGASYYFRGDVSDNYVNYSGMCWRIVRIEGDGSVKLILSDSDAECSNATLNKTESAFIGTGNYGFDASNNGNYLNPLDTTGSMKYILDVWMSENLNLYKIKNDKWCLENLTNKYSDELFPTLLTDQIIEQNSVDNHFVYDYESYASLLGDKTKISLMCKGQTFNSKIGTLTLEEATFAGGYILSNVDSYKYYLDNNAINSQWLTLSLAKHSPYNSTDYAASLYNYGFISSDKSGSIRPSITLVAGTEITTGDGTLEHPYNVKTY